MGKLDQQAEDFDQQFLDAAKKAKENANQGFKKIDDGQYTCKLEKAEKGVSNNGRKQILWKFIIMDGDLTGDAINKYDGLDRKEGLEYICQTFQKFGYDPEEIIPFDSKAPAVLAEITERHQFCVVTAKTKGDFQNFYVNKVFADGVNPLDDDD